MFFVRLVCVLACGLVVAACTPSKDNLVVVLPESNGRVGAVVVHNANGDLLLNKPYAAGGAGAGSSAMKSVDTSGAEVSQIFGAAIAARPMPPQSFILYFKSGTDILTLQSTLELKKVFVELSKRRAAEIKVTGYTDTVGNSKDNDQLSLERAGKLRLLLIQQGIHPEDIIAAGRGERELLVPTPDQTDEAKNRRVEVTVH